jgi:deoxyxylulose-5-phosphate synthase
MLKEAAKNCIIALINDNQFEVTDYAGKIEILVNAMNKDQHEIYVDRVAKNIWLAKGDRRAKQMYEEAHTKVKEMFVNLYKKLNEWIREIQRHHPH